MIGFTVALKKEALPLLAKFTDLERIPSHEYEYWVGKIGEKQCSLIVSGVGKIHSATATRFLLDKFPIRQVIHFGSCGALCTSLKVADIVFADRIVEHDFIERFSKKPSFPQYVVDSTFVDAVSRFNSKLPNPARIGTMVSGNEDIVEAARRNILKEKFAGLTVDWETAGSAITCKIARIPFMAFRIVSDHACEEAASDFNKNIADVSSRLADYIFSFVTHE